MRIVLGTADDASVATEGVLTFRSGELVVSDRSLWPWRRLTVPAGRHEVRLTSRAETGGITYEVWLTPI